ncbi:hypothetical protein BDC45DRAFT_535177 [Circinella umbellata]|nr:hypothetical protein BDC45DRAFT_535177 [Circinella umbellata]
MDDNQKWLLKTDKDGKIIYVEDIMYQRGKKLEYEHVVHSFILDVDDNGWNEYYTKEDIKKQYKIGDIILPVLPKHITKCSMHVTKPYRKDRTSMATFIRVNADREVSGTKPIDDQHRSVRPDMVVMNDRLEVVCCECRREDCGGGELVERNLHVPKILKNMFRLSLLKAKIKNLLLAHQKIATLNENSTRMRATIMDCLDSERVNEPVYGFQEQEGDTTINCA